MNNWQCRILNTESRETKGESANVFLIVYLEKLSGSYIVHGRGFQAEHGDLIELRKQIRDQGGCCGWNLGGRVSERRALPREKAPDIYMGSH